MDDLVISRHNGPIKKLVCRSLKKIGKPLHGQYLPIGIDVRDNAIKIKKPEREAN